MTASRQYELSIAKTVIPIPCYFPSVSSVKTNLMPVDYLEFLDAALHPLFLTSAYDIANSTHEHRERMDTVLRNCKENGAAILMDSGNYESFWKGDPNWIADKYHDTAREANHDLCFCYDNQDPPDTPEAIADDVAMRVIRDQAHASGTVVPIVHGRTSLLAPASYKVAEQLYPVLLAVPERALGEGIVARTQTLRKIRRALDNLDFYCPLHLLGTGNPLSIIAYTMAGADSFDGLEWCQTVVDHDSGKLFHFQQWDLFQDQTQWGRNGMLPYNQSVLMHNLEFYRQFMGDLRNALMSDASKDFLRRYVPENQSRLLLNAIEGND